MIDNVIIEDEEKNFILDVIKLIVSGLNVKYVKMDMF